MTDEEYEAWVNEQPPHVQAIARKYPMRRDGKVVCYRSTQHPRMHYAIYSISEHGDGPCTLTLIHGADSTLPGISTFGQPPEQLVECGCGRWQVPTRQQARRTHALMKRIRDRRN